MMQWTAERWHTLCSFVVASTASLRLQCAKEDEQEGCSKTLVDLERASEASLHRRQHLSALCCVFLPCSSLSPMRIGVVGTLLAAACAAALLLAPVHAAEDSVVSSLCPTATTPSASSRLHYRCYDPLMHALVHVMGVCRLPCSTRLRRIIRCMPRWTSHWSDLHCQHLHASWRPCPSDLYPLPVHVL